MSKPQITPKDVSDWLCSTKDPFEEGGTELQALKKALRPGDIVAAAAATRKLMDMESAHEQRDKDLRAKICEVYRRSGSLSGVRKTDLYIEIKTFYNTAWQAAKYDPLNLSKEPEVKTALERLANFILAPEIIDGLPVHLLPIPNELYQWVPPNLPPVSEFSPGGRNNYKVALKRQTAFVNAARLRHFCDPLAVDLNKRQGEGTARSCADDYIMVLLGKLEISLK